jgi:hypothetical protein
VKQTATGVAVDGVEVLEGEDDAKDGDGLVGVDVIKANSYKAISGVGLT